MHTNDIAARKTDTSFAAIDPSAGEMAAATESPQDPTGEKRDFHAELFQDRRSGRSPSALPTTQKKRANLAPMAAGLSDTASTPLANMGAKHVEPTPAPQRDLQIEASTSWKNRLSFPHRGELAENLTPSKGTPAELEKGRTLKATIRGEATTRNTAKETQIEPLTNMAKPMNAPPGKAVTPLESQSSMRSPVVAFLSGRLDEVEPRAIPQLIAGNRFINGALSSTDISQYMNTPVPVNELMKDLDLDTTELHQIFGSNNIPDFLTPGDLFKSLHLDCNRIGAELKLLKANIQFDGLSSYMQRATLLANDNPSGDPSPARQAKQVREPEKPTNKSDLISMANLAALSSPPFGLRPSSIESNNLTSSNEIFPMVAAPLGIAALRNPLAEPTYLTEDEAKSMASMPMHGLRQEVTPFAPLQPEAAPVASFTLVKPLPSDVIEGTAGNRSQNDRPPAVPGETVASTRIVKASINQQVDPFAELGAIMNPATTQTIKAQSLEFTPNPAENIFTGASIPTNLSNMLSGKVQETSNFPKGTAPDAQPINPDDLLSPAHGHRGPDFPAPQSDILAMAQSTNAEDSFPIVHRLPPDYQRELLNADQRPLHDIKADVPAAGAAQPIVKDSSVQNITTSNFIPLDSHMPTGENARLMAQLLQDQRDNRLSEAGPKIAVTAPLVSAMSISEPSNRSLMGSQADNHKDTNQNSQQQSYGPAMPPMAMTEAKSSAVFSPQGPHPGKEPGNMDPAMRAQIVQNIMDNSNMMLKKGGGSIRLDLSSRELGALDIAVKVVDNKLDLNILAHSPQTRDLIIADIPRLRESLQHQNIGLNDVNISVSQGNSSAQSFSDGSQQQRAFFQDYQERTTDNARSASMVTQSTQTISPKQWEHYRQPHTGRIQVLA